MTTTDDKRDAPTKREVSLTYKPKVPESPFQSIQKMALKLKFHKVRRPPDSQQARTPMVYRTPADAALAYNKGGLRIRSSDPETIDKAIALLKHAREIYVENERVRDAAYAAALAAEGCLKLGRKSEAGEHLAFANKHLQSDKDADVIEHCAKLVGAEDQ